MRKVKKSHVGSENRRKSLRNDGYGGVILMKQKTLLCIILIVGIAVLAVFSEPATFSFYDSQRSFTDFIVKINFDDIDAYMMIDDGDVHYWLFKNKELLVDGISGAAQFSYATEDCSFGVEECGQALIANIVFSFLFL